MPGNEVMTSIDSIFEEVESAADCPTICVSAYDSEGQLYGYEILGKILHRLREKFAELKDSKGRYFYLWYDAQAGQVRGSSAETDKLPFRCDIIPTNNLGDIRDDAVADISSLYENGALKVYIELLR